MQCFKCTQIFRDMPAYFKHIKESHDMSGKGRFQCTLCSEILKDFGRFKKHTDRCFDTQSVFNESRQLQQSTFLEAYNAPEIEDHQITVFRSKLRHAALRLVTKMNAQMDASRSLVFKTISNFEEFMDEVISGIPYRHSSNISP